MERESLSGNFQQDIRVLEDTLRVRQSFDVVLRRIEVGERQAAILFIDGFAKDDIMEKILEYLMSLSREDMQDLPRTEDFSSRFVPYVEVETTSQMEQIRTQVLSGAVALLIDGYREAVLIDARTYPVRGVGEPDDDRCCAAPGTGLVETLVFNTALIRRRIRDPRLTMEIHQVGSDFQKRRGAVLFGGGSGSEAGAPTAGQAVPRRCQDPDHGAGKSGGEPGAPPMVESLPQGAVYGAARLRGGQCGGGKGTAAGGQFAFGHDPAYRPVRFCSGYQ